MVENQGLREVESQAFGEREGNRGLGEESQGSEVYQSQRLVGGNLEFVEYQQRHVGNLEFVVEYQQRLVGNRGLVVGSPGLEVGN